MEAMTWLSCAWVDDHTHDIRLEAAMAKVFCSETSENIIDETLQLRGGRGYERASSLKARGERPDPVERMARDSRINMIVEGTSEILRLFIAREALDRHLQIAGDVLNPKLGVGTRLVALLKATAFYAWWYPWQWIAPMFIRWPRHAGLGRIGRHMRFAERASHTLARKIFHLMLLNGPKLERRQLQLMRVVDVATDLFAMAASIGRARTPAALGASGNGHQEEAWKNADDVVDFFCAEARVRIRANFRALRCNADSKARKVGKQILAGEEKWLEKEIVR
jgi:hypothetical protein